MALMTGVSVSSIMVTEDVKELDQIIYPPFAFLREASTLEPENSMISNAIEGIYALSNESLKDDWMFWYSSESRRRGITKEEFLQNITKYFISSFISLLSNYFLYNVFFFFFSSFFSPSSFF